MTFGPAYEKRYVIEQFRVDKIPHATEFLRVYVQQQWWKLEAKSTLFPPVLIGPDGDGPMFNAANMLWYDKETDIALLQFATPGGHGGRYDSTDLEEGEFDSRRYENPVTATGCIFAPSGAFDFYAMGTTEVEVRGYGKWPKKHGSNRPYSPRATVLNLAVEGLSQVEIARHLGVSRNAIHLIIQVMPQAVKTNIHKSHYNGPDDRRCVVKGCELAVRGMHKDKNLYCDVHRPEPVTAHLVNQRGEREAQR